MTDRLTFACPHCGTVLTVPVALAGQSGSCPSCEQLIAAPHPAPAAGLSPEAPVTPLGEVDAGGLPRGKPARWRLAGAAGLVAALALIAFVLWKRGSHGPAAAHLPPAAAVQDRGKPECLSPVMQAGSWEKARPYFLLTPKQEDGASRMAPPFLERFKGAVPEPLSDFDLAGATNLTAWQVVSAEDRSRLVLLVEKNGAESRIRWDALAQQLEPAFARVVSGHGTTTEPLYLRVSLLPSDRPSEGAPVRWQLDSAFASGQAGSVNAFAASRLIEDKLRMLAGRSRPSPALVRARLDWRASPGGGSSLIIDDVASISGPL